MNSTKKLLAAAGLAVGLAMFAFFPAKTPFDHIPGDLRDAPNSASALEQLGYESGGDIPVPLIYSSDTASPDAAAGPVTAPVPFGSAYSVLKTAVLVHGFNSTSSELDPLEAELKRRGFSVTRFKYDYTQALDLSADELTQFVLNLSSGTGGERITVIAHSLGGLVSRRAMITGRGESLADTGIPVLLITVASPFGGFSSANATLLCPFNIAGINECFRSLGTIRDFIRNPGVLGQNISHIKIETNEKGKTRVQNGAQVSDAQVMPGNQANSAVDSDPGLKAKITLNEGHVGVLSTDGAVSGQLLEALDRYLQ